VSSSAKTTWLARKLREKLGANTLAWSVLDRHLPASRTAAARPPKPARGELSSLLGGQSRLRANFRALLAAKPVPGDEIARFWPPKLARGNFSRRLGLENGESISSGEILAEKNG
jgi:hypothetical protein